MCCRCLGFPLKVLGRLTGAVHRGGKGEVVWPALDAPAGCRISGEIVVLIFFMLNVSDLPRPRANKIVPGGLL